MKRLALVAAFLMLLYMHAFSQSSFAKFKFEEAEEAFSKADYSTALGKLNEAENLIGKINPPILYLRILAQDKLIATSKEKDIVSIASLLDNCDKYLKEYESVESLRDKFRDVYNISERNKEYRIDRKMVTMALNGNGEACYKLAKLYETKAHYNQEAVQYWYNNAKQKGEVRAMVELGLIYQYGKGVPKDPKYALKLYEAAASQQYGEAAFHSGLMYYHGEGVKQDYEQALKWFSQGVVNDYAPCFLFLGMMYKKGEGVKQDFREAMNWLQKAAAKGNAGAMTRIGDFYKTGDGVAQNISEAIKWYEKSIQSGNDIFLFGASAIGDLYFEGTGVSQSYTEALSWYKKADGRNNGDASKGKFKCYDKMLELGMPMDYNDAYNCFKEDKFFRGIAEKNIGLLYESGKGVTQNILDAIEWFQKAAEKGNKAAMLKLAEFYTKGRGVKKDKTLAKQWTEKAATIKD